MFTITHVNNISIIAEERQKFPTLNSIQVLERHIKSIVVCQIGDNTMELPILYRGNGAGFLN